MWDWFEAQGIVIVPLLAVGLLAVIVVLGFAIDGINWLWEHLI